MAKSQTQQGTAMSQGLSKSSTAQTQAGLFGGGAFGSGLTPQYTKQQGWQGQSREAAMQSAQDVAKTGGYDPTTLATINKFETTGGFSPQEKSAYMRQATSGVADTYKNLMRTAEQRTAATGGAGGAGALSEMARQGSQAEAKADTAALNDLNTQIRNNMMSGVSAAAGVAGGRREGTQLLHAMYDSDTGALTSTGQQILSLMGIDSTNQIAAMNAMVQLSRNPGLAQTIIGDIAAFVGG